MLRWWLVTYNLRGFGAMVHALLDFRLFKRASRVSSNPKPVQCILITNQQDFDTYQLALSCANMLQKFKQTVKATVPSLGRTVLDQLIIGQHSLNYKVLCILYYEYHILMSDSHHDSVFIVGWLQLYCCSRASSLTPMTGYKSTMYNLSFHEQFYANQLWIPSIR